MTLSKTVQETQNDANDVTPNSTAGVNYWGYATLNYFAPDRRYSSDRSPGPTRELVKDFHDLAVEVFIDEVYNRTGEGEAWNSADKTIYNLYSFGGQSDLLSADRRHAVFLGQHRGRRQFQHLQHDRAGPDRRFARLLARCHWY